MIDKKHMTEEDIKLQFITPAITAKWNLNRITMETKITTVKSTSRAILFFVKNLRRPTIFFISMLTTRLP